MSGRKQAGTLVIEAAIFTPIIAFTHLVNINSPFNLFFKWAVPFSIYFLYLLRVFSRGRGEFEKSDSLIPYISSLSEIGVIYVVYGLTSEYSTLPVALTAIVLFSLGSIFVTEYWIDRFSTLSDFTSGLFERRINQDEISIPFLQNMSYMAQNLDTSQDEEYSVGAFRWVKSIITLVLMVFILILLILLFIYPVLRLFVDISLITTILVSFSLLCLKTVLAVFYSYGSVDYFDIMSLRLGVLSLTINGFLLINLIKV